jgi:divalent metal cation (Fe/Co/Zn/Cd) transporter
MPDTPPQTARPGTGGPNPESSADADVQSGACCTPNQAAHDAGWVRAARHAKALAWFSLAWMTGEGVLGLVASIAANSIALIGWALGSVIEGLASVIVIWRFTGTRTVSETSERRAQRAVAISFFLLAPYIGVESIRDLASGHQVTPSLLGVLVTAASLLVMPPLGRAKQRLGAQLDSGATTGEGIQNYLCAAQAGAVLLGLGATAAFGWTWLDPVVGLLLAGGVIPAEAGLAWGTRHSGSGSRRSAILSAYACR